jgi:hypothetical protein
MPIQTFLRKFARDYQYRTDAADDPQRGRQTAFRMHFLKAKAKPKSTTPITARLRLYRRARYHLATDRPQKS